MEGSGSMESMATKETLEDKISKAVDQMLENYPKTSELPEEFSVELEKLKTYLSLVALGQGPKMGDSKEVVFDKRKNQPVVFTPKIEEGDEVMENKTTMGEIISAMEWGEGFNLDKESFDKKLVGRQIYEKYVLALTEQKTLNLLDQYILDKEIQENGEKGNVYNKEAYEGIKETKGVSNTSLKKAGVIAEKMVQSLLARVSIDDTNAKFELVRTNAYQDVELKIDFIVRKQSTTEQGIRVESAQDIKKVQFTISNNTEKLAQKERQVSKLEDTIVISMPNLEVTAAFNKWLNSDIVGGPDVFLDEETQKEIKAKMLE